MTKQSDCLGCQINAGKIVPPGGMIHRTRYWILDHAMGQTVGAPLPLKGFLMLKAARHVEHMSDLHPGEAAEFGEVLYYVSRALRVVVKPEKIHYFCMGELVRHVHWYIVPRYSHMPASGPEVLSGVFERWPSTQEEVIEVARRMRETLPASAPRETWI